MRPELVEIRYRFVNSAAELEVPVVLPLPDIAPAILSTASGGPRRDPDNVIDLRVTVDGQPVTADVTLHAMVGTRDVTAVLQREQVPVSLFARNLETSLTGRPIATQRALAAAGAVAFGELGGYEIKWTMRGWFPGASASRASGPWRSPCATARSSAVSPRTTRSTCRRRSSAASATWRAASRAAAAGEPMGIRVGLSLGGTTNWAGPPEVFGPRSTPAIRRWSVTRLEGMTLGAGPARRPLQRVRAAGSSACCSCRCAPIAPTAPLRPAIRASRGIADVALGPARGRLRAR